MIQAVVWVDPAGEHPGEIDLARLWWPKWLTHPDGRIFRRQRGSSYRGERRYLCEEPPRPEKPFTVELWNLYGASIGTRQLWHPAPTVQFDGVVYDRWDGDANQLIYVARQTEQRAS